MEAITTPGPNEPKACGGAPLGASPCQSHARAIRLAEVARQLLVSLDQFAQVALVGIAYALHLTDVCPSADETISSYVGRGEMRGAWWAMVLAPAIDALFVLFGEQPGHCQRNVETAFLGLPPTS